MELFSATVSVESQDRFFQLQHHCLDILDPAPDSSGVAGRSIGVFALDQQLEALRREGFDVERVEAKPDFFQKRFDLVNREPYEFSEDPDHVLRSPSAALYFTSAAIDQMLDAWARAWPQLIHLWQLPDRTWGDGAWHIQPHSCRAALVGAGATAGRRTVLISSGLHAREWIAPDACMTALNLLVASYAANTGIRLSPNATSAGKTFTREQVKAVLERLLVIFYPNANPDGRDFSQAAPQNVLWRKNRRPFQEGYGVDVNRNFNFLWQYRGAPYDDFKITDHLVPGGSSYINDLYKGTFAGSEPETRNMQFIIDSYPTLEFFVDVHSNTQTIYLPWGDAPNQQDKQPMNFSNPAYNDWRGRNPAYGEYLLKTDYDNRESVAKQMLASLKKVQGTTYNYGQSAVIYGHTVASADDYALSRSFLDPKRRRVHTMTFECGVSKGDYAPDTKAERDVVVRDTCAALIEMCCIAAGVPSPTVA